MAWSLAAGYRPPNPSFRISTRLMYMEKAGSSPPLNVEELDCFVDILGGGV
jgi:hypothetical protein